MVWKVSISVVPVPVSTSKQPCEAHDFNIQLCSSIRTSKHININIDIHGYPWIPWIYMDSMDIHGFHGYPWNPWISMESMYIHGIHGYPWISMFIFICLLVRIEEHNWMLKSCASQGCLEVDTGTGTTEMDTFQTMSNHRNKDPVHITNVFQMGGGFPWIPWNRLVYLD